MKAIPMALGRAGSCGACPFGRLRRSSLNSYLKEQVGELGTFLPLESRAQRKPRWGIEWYLLVFVSANDSECFDF